MPIIGLINSMLLYFILLSIDIICNIIYEYDFFVLIFISKLFSLYSSLLIVHI